MAEQYSPESDMGRGRKLKHRYTPAPPNARASALRTRGDLWCDFYTGTRAQLLDAGVVPDGMFPGDTGMPQSCATIWPMDAVAGAADRYSAGTLSITRLLSGRFTAALTVAKQEQQRRESRAEADRNARRRKYELSRQREDAERQAGQSLKTIINTWGLDEVRAYVEQLHREQHPRRPCNHLRLA